MNIKKIAGDMDIEEEQYLKLLNIFFKAARSDMSKLQFAIEERNLDQIIYIAHQIKGAAINLDFGELFKMAERIEKDARDGEFEKIPEKFQKLRKMFEAVVNSFKCLL